MLRDSRVQLGVALDVQLVDYAVGEWRGSGDRRGRRAIGHYDAERNRRERVGRIGNIVRRRYVVQDGARVVHPPGDRAGVRVEQELGRIEPGAQGRIPGPVHPIAVALLVSYPGNEHSPYPVWGAGHVVVVLAPILRNQGEFDPSRPRRPECEELSSVTAVRTENR